MSKHVKDRPSLLNIDFGRTGLKVRDLLSADGKLLVVELLPTYLGAVILVADSFTPVFKFKDKARRFTQYVYVNVVYMLNDFVSIPDFLEHSAELDYFTILTGITASDDSAFS